VNRVQPYSREAEQALLGAMLLDKDAIDTAMEQVAEPDFYLDSHRLVFRVLATLMAAGAPVDMVSVVEELKREGHLEAVGGATYISSLANSVPALATANVEHYAGIVAEKARLRRVIRVAREAAQAAYEGDPDAVDKLQRGAMDIERRGGVEPVSYYDTYSRTLDILAERHKNGGALTGVTSGFIDLDQFTAGFQPGELIILAGRPSMGKSALAQCIAENAAVAGHGVLMAILEDSPSNLMQRSIARAARLDAQKLRTGRLTQEDWNAIIMAGVTIPKLPVWYLGPAGVTLQSLRSTARKLKRQGNLGLVVVDYLQLLEPSRARENRNLEIADISRGLKGIAQELELPLIAVAQLSRGPEARQNKRPMLSDLRESGQIEQDADVVAFVYREDYYDPATDRKGITEVILAKQRNGPVGTVELRWDARLVSFSNLAKGV
jgi:replicative DNA helicase